MLPPVINADEFASEYCQVSWQPGFRDFLTQYLLFDRPVGRQALPPFAHALVSCLLVAHRLHRKVLHIARIIAQIHSARVGHQPIPQDQTAGWSTDRLNVIRFCERTASISMTRMRVQVGRKVAVDVWHTAKSALYLSRVGQAYEALNAHAIKLPRVTVPV